ncbi:MAG: PrsW family intramembrane metalloprotease [Anaerolineae bacterium]|nr:PrsW family intramembrane metalloprotease [Anaerolineae bacterium]
MTRLPFWFKRVLMIAGVMLVIPGLVFILVYCLVIPVLMTEGDPGDALIVSVVTLVFLALTLGAGLMLLIHSSRSVRGVPSAVLRLPKLWILLGAFGICVVLGGAIVTYHILEELLFPPLFLIAAALPPLWAVTWFFGCDAQDGAGLTWRRGLLAFSGGATVSVFIALILEILAPAFVLSLVRGLADVVGDQVSELISALANHDLAEALTRPGFLYAFAHLALIAPLAEEFAKPLVTLPLLKRLSRREAFWVGALAGAGFAALENVLYAGFGFYLWTGILVLRAIGSAIHPLGAGLVALAWRDLLCSSGNPRVWREALKRFGIAAGMHALWNGGALIVITLGGARFFGELPPEIDLLGLSTGGTLLALLIVLGLGALWAGRMIGTALSQPPVVTPATGAPADTDALSAVSAPGAPATDALPVFSDRALAIWALACLVMIVPAGITGLKLLFWR